MRLANGRNGSKADISSVNFSALTSVPSGNVYGNNAASEQNTSLYQSDLAETEGFEPSVRESPVRRFSKPLVSATHPRLREGFANGGSYRRSLRQSTARP